MTSWRPTADKFISSTYQMYEALVAADPQAATSTKLTPGHWPPPNAHELKLERCMRIYPHLQDSSGFFVAVLERKLTEVPQIREKKRTIENVETSELETKKPRLESEPETSETLVDSVSGVDVKSVTQEGGGGSTDVVYFPVPTGSSVAFMHLTSMLTSEFPSSNVLVRNPEGDVPNSDGSYSIDIYTREPDLIKLHLTLFVTTTTITQ
ncbi:hypothetical protein C8J55DRAFT_558584 [Lentinula edodes]|uniref:SAM-dependent MTase RsmB/NOP-type domain-containing protein n=1 Tax=Lentinula lateritia TaxID=40482 RepID=A0A9W9AML8_9AGAR|nr:hypothetical protein C8J55DRAFT_558584 [Lentinula edodes]